MIHYVTYKCPKCSRKITRDIDYPEYEQFVDPKNTSITISSWCPRCGSTHTYDISISKNKKETYRIRTSYFLCDGERENCRLKLKESEVNK